MSQFAWENTFPYPYNAPQAWPWLGSLIKSAVGIARQTLGEKSVESHNPAEKMQ
jgi:hypothetical protein